MAMFRNIFGRRETKDSDIESAPALQEGFHNVTESIAAEVR